MTTKNLLYNRWFSDQIESHCCGIKTHPKPFGKRAKNIEKVKDQSQLLNEYLEGKRRLQKNSRNAPITTLEMEETQELPKGNYLVSQKIISRN